MATLALTHEQQGIVVFLVWRSLKYPQRLALSLLSIGAGLWLQVVLQGILPGCLLVAFGNALLLVRGYNNRVEFGRYDAAAEWERATLNQVLQIKDLHRRMQRWDRSLIDITNRLGVVALAVLVSIAFLFLIGSSLPDDWNKIIAVNGAVLLLPHWVTGTRRVLTRPSLLIKIAMFEDVLNNARDKLLPHTVEFFVLLKGAKTRVPDDVKFRVRLAQQKDGFLGLYGQVAINTVNGNSYPYFYTVLVAKKDFGLNALYLSTTTPEKTTLEFRQEGEVEVLVVRQTTTRTSGYHTVNRAARALMAAGLRLAEQVGRA